MSICSPVKEWIKRRCGDVLGQGGRGGGEGEGEGGGGLKSLLHSSEEKQHL